MVRAIDADEIIAEAIGEGDNLYLTTKMNAIA